VTKVYCHPDYKSPDAHALNVFRYITWNYVEKTVRFIEKAGIPNQAGRSMYGMVWYAMCIGTL